MMPAHSRQQESGQKGRNQRSKRLLRAAPTDAERPTQHGCQTRHDVRSCGIMRTWPTHPDSRASPASGICRGRTGIPGNRCTARGRSCLCTAAHTAPRSTRHNLGGEGVSSHQPQSLPRRRHVTWLRSRTDLLGGTLLQGNWEV